MKNPHLLINGQPIDYDAVPVRYMADTMKNYFEHGILLGSFSTALLEGDFMRVCAHADDTNRENLFAWGRWLYNHAPSGSYGSRESVKAWVTTARQKKEAEDMAPMNLPIACLRALYARYPLYLERTSRERAC